MLTLLDNSADTPAGFPSPFNGTPHPLARVAAGHLQQRLPAIAAGHDYRVDGGKMFGVLVVRDQSDRLGYLAAYSGMLADKWCHNSFVPPLFNPDARNDILIPGERELQRLSDRITAIATSREIKLRQRWLRRAESQTQRQLAAMRQRNHDRKRERDRLRLIADVRHNELALAAQSREDRREWRALKTASESRLAAARRDCDSMYLELDQLRDQRRVLSRQLQTRLFDDYHLCASNGERRPIRQLFGDALPPGGAGDCAAPKLLQYANLEGLQPVCLAEFWWEPGDGQRGLRRHRSFYPACRSKCGPILPFLLTGVNVDTAAHLSLPVFSTNEPRLIYEDQDIIVVSKPAGMLSVPGITHDDSAESRLQARYGGDSLQRLLVHRLDQATSGLLLAARHRRAHKALQQQFERRLVHKRYVALLETTVHSDAGQIDLPVRVDLEDRPRQMVCYQHGKPAVTRYEVIESIDAGTRVHFYPCSGRTHQLRVHAAHPDGLNAPIIGDELYGKAGARLLLHADYLRFLHPSGHIIEFEDPAPF